MALDIDSLTVGEVSEIEELTGMAVTVIGDLEKPKGRLMGAMLYIFKRRENPDYTLTDAFNTPLSEATKLLGLDEEVDEDSEEGKGESSETSGRKS